MRELQTYQAQAERFANQLEGNQLPQPYQEPEPPVPPNPFPMREVAIGTAAVAVTGGAVWTVWILAPMLIVVAKVAAATAVVVVLIGALTPDQPTPPRLPHDDFYPREPRRGRRVIIERTEKIVIEET